jgi:hypothetical protein
MSDIARGLREQQTRWLVARNDLRAVAQRLAAAEYDLRRTAVRNPDDRDLATLVAQVRAQYANVSALQADLECRIAEVGAACAASDALARAAVVAAARASRREHRRTAPNAD